MQLNLTINEKNYELHTTPDAMLYQELRKLGFCSVKRGCDTGNCGICTVLVDGLPMLSCTLPVFRMVGKKITTLEGVEDKVKEFAAYLSREGADQCGFCSSGFILNVLYLKETMKEFEEEKVKAHLANNLCRCTGYVSQMRAIEKYMEEC